MTELIKIDYANDQPLVSARDLHEFLEVGARFNDWFPRMCEYGFSDGNDYYSFLSNRSDGLPGKQRQDAALTIDMAKEICMLQRNDKGKQARQYFLQLEKDWNSPEKVMARALRIADQRIRKLEAKVAEDRPKVVFADAVDASESSILVGEMAKILKQNGVENMGQNRFFAWLRDNGYLVKRRGTDYNMPTQRSMEQGLFCIKETAVAHSDGHTSINKTPKITGKGQQHFVNVFIK